MSHRLLCKVINISAARKVRLDGKSDISQPPSPWVHCHSVCWEQNRTFIIPGAPRKDRILQGRLWKQMYRLNMAQIPREWCLRGHREPPNPPPLQALTGAGMSWGNHLLRVCRHWVNTGELWLQVKIFRLRKNPPLSQHSLWFRKKTEMVRVYSLICKHLFGKKSFVMVVWAEKA